MAQIFAIVNQKGGVGKTTTTLNLGAYLANAGKRVLIVDLDPQGNASSGIGINHREVEHGLYEALVGHSTVDQALHETNHEGLHIIPTNQSLAGASVELVGHDNREFVLHKVLEPLKEKYDFILVDCPPSLGLLTLNGLVASDQVVIPIQAEYYALEGLGQLLNTIELVRDNLKPELNVFGAVITMYDQRTKLSKDVLTELYKHFPNKIFRSVIPRSVRLAEAPSFGQTILGYDPKSKAARAYERLTNEFLLRDEEHRETETL
ncbi:ParA family protein [Candidatus Uhrbacteria bacterium]|jgi:chromosome partitioning protein|nr:ParA family protein [Candidatus Uhrbacteria bacterium]